MATMTTSVPSAETQGRPTVTARALSAVSELLIVGTLFLVYKAGRVVAAQHISHAFANSNRIWDAERFLHLPSELGVQHLLEHSHSIEYLATLFYATVHFPLTFTILGWLWLKHPEYYRRTRTVFAIMTLSALGVHFLFPAAPPRMMTALGFQDLGHLMGTSVYGPPATDTLSDQYAAMPSLHVGWAVLVALAMIKVGHRRSRWLWLIHPLVTTIVVVGTANHYWLDGAVAIILLVIADRIQQHLPDPGSLRRRVSAAGKAFRARRTGPQQPEVTGPVGVGETGADRSRPVTGSMSSGRLLKAHAGLPRQHSAASASTAGRPSGPGQDERGS